MDRINDKSQVIAQPFFLVDAFVSGPFTGNPAGVCLLREEKSAAWMQALAAEINQAETAFLLPRADGSWQLRWFTPAIEINLCGHATLASAHALWQHTAANDTTLRFHTHSGLLTAKRQGEMIQLDFPADPPQAEAAPAGLIELLGGEPHWFGRGQEHLIAVLDSAEQVRTLHANYALIARFTPKGLIVTAPSDQPGLDIVSRFFAPNAGIPEDSVTGAAHCILAVYWAERLGKTHLQALQASPRTGLITLDWQGERVLLTGKARTMLKGEVYA